jgi:hypothetical protein
LRAKTLIRILNLARHGNGAMVLEHTAVSKRPSQASAVPTQHRPPGKGLHFESLEVLGYNVEAMISCGFPAQLEMRSPLSSCPCQKLKDFKLSRSNSPTSADDCIVVDQDHHCAMHGRPKKHCCRTSVLSQSEVKRLGGGYARRLSLWLGTSLIAVGPGLPESHTTD